VGLRAAVSQYLHATPRFWLARWYARRCAQARLRWAEDDLRWLKQQQQLDVMREQVLRDHIAELRIDCALLAD